VTTLIAHRDAVDGRDAAEPVAVVGHEEPDLAWEWATSTCPPAGRVARYIGYRERSVTPLVRRQVPHSAYTLIFSFGDAIAVGGERHTSFVAGLYDAPVHTEFVGTQHGIEIMLPPALAYALFGGVPLGELANAAVPVHELLGDLDGRLADAPDWASRFALLDKAFARRLADAPAPATEVRWAWQQLVATAGRASVTALAEEIGWSRRHFAARFREQVGLTPKTAARVLRFERATRLLRQASPAAVALACGYYDQAHLNREFRELAGITPVQFEREVTFVQDSWPDAA
jgi:AraC-like DNA-binding protein